MTKILGVVAVIALIVFLIAIGPLAIIWALNTLFPVLAIPYTGWTWLAALILAAVVGPTVKTKK